MGGRHHGLALACLAAGAACGSEPASLERASSCEVTTRIPLINPPSLDLLFVLDDSPGIRDRQAALEANLPWFMDVLASREGGIPDLHLGVISADLADEGRLLAAPRLPGCAPPADPFILHHPLPDGGVRTNYPGALRDAFPCIARLGSQGGPPRPIEALRRALPGAAEVGFFREDATLGVVIISSADDAEPTDWLVEGRPRGSWTIVSVAAPPGATALEALAHGTHGTFTALANDDLSDLLSPFVPLLARLLGPPCLFGPLDDTDVLPDEPGLQLGCAVEMVRFPDGARAARSLPRCRLLGDGGPAPGERPCWWARPRAECDLREAEGSGLELVLERDDWLPGGTLIEARCPTVCAR